MSSSACQMWLTNNAGADRIQLPVNPEKITISQGNKNETVNVAGLGEVTIIQDRAALQFEFSSHFPGVKHQGCVVKTLYAPSYYVDKIRKWIESKKPVKYIVTGCNINVFCSIESFSYYEEGGDPDTLHYTLKLKEYREVKIRQLDTSPKIPAVVENPNIPDPKIAVKQVGTVTGGSVYYRRGPSTSYKAYGIKHKGDKLDVIGKSGNWYKFTYAKGEGGVAWMSGKYVKITETKTYQKGKVSTDGSRLVLYKSASNTSAELAKMPNGSSVEVLARSGSWYQVTYSGKTGWCIGSGIKFQ